MALSDVVKLAGGLALFLYGMNIMGSGLEKLAGGRMESILQKLTSSLWKGVLFGAIITALIQSSSGTTVIVIGLVNSGIMQFSQAIGIIMGANIGTTITSQILRMADISGDNIFLEIIKPATFAPVLALVGVVLFVFFGSVKKKNIGQILLGFGILFIGMGMIELAVSPLRESELFKTLFSTLTNPLFGILAGALITGILQSSSASVGILQALSSTGAVTWGNAIPIILGQNIGTCATGLLSSIGASKSAKRVAIVHLYFNIVGTVLFVGIIYGAKALMGGFGFWDTAIDRGGIANFHTLFNLAATLVFLPFNKLLVWLAEKTVPIKEEDEYPELHITVLDERLYNSPSMAIAQARKAVEQMATVGRINQKNSTSLMLSFNEEKIQLAKQREDVVDRLDVSVSNYLVKMNKLDLNEAESREVTMLLNFVTEFERIGDYALDVVERSGEVFDKQVVFSDTAKSELALLNDALGEIFDYTIAAFVDNDLREAEKVEPLEETIDVMCETLRNKHIKRLKEGRCNIDAGIIFLEVLTAYERISDHCSNVAARLLSSATSDEDFDPHKLRRDLHEGSYAWYEQMMQDYKVRYLDKLTDKSKNTNQLSFDTLPTET